MAMRQSHAQLNSVKALAWAEERKSRIEAAALRRGEGTRSSKSKAVRVSSPQPSREMGSALRDALICRCPYAVNRLGLAGQNGGTPNQWQLYAESVGFTLDALKHMGMTLPSTQRDARAPRSPQTSPERCSFESMLRQTSPERSTLYDFKH